MKDEATHLQALGWAHNLDTEEQIHTEGAEFETWVAQSTAHAEAYHLAERARCQAELYRMAMVESGIRDPMVLVNRIKQQRAPRPRRTALRIGLPLTAGTALMIVLALIVLPAYTEQLPWSYYHTTVGQVHSVTLDDGSTVILDAESSLRTRLSFVRRDLVLERGQALFAVRPLWLRPFEVQVNASVLHATGTRFAVDRKSAEESQALVTEGEVQVRSSEDATADPQERTVSAGEVVQIGPHGIQVGKLDPAAAQSRLAWVDGQLDFDETLRAAVNEFNRYNQRKLVIDDPHLDAVPVVGRYDAHNPDLFADDLHQSHGIRHTSVGTPGSKQGEIHLQPPPSSVPQGSVSR